MKCPECGADDGLPYWATTKETTFKPKSWWDSKTVTENESWKSHMDTAILKHYEGMVNAKPLLDALKNTGTYQGGMMAFGVVWEEDDKDLFKIGRRFSDRILRAHKKGGKP